MIEEYQRVGMNLMDAFDSAKMWSYDPGEFDFDGETITYREPASGVESQNDKALQTLSTLMAGAVRG